MDQYQIETPNTQYNGRVLGLRFEKGRAILSEYTLDKTLGNTLEDTARLFREDFGYKVTRLKTVKVVEEPVEGPVPVLPIQPPKRKGGRPKRIVSPDPKQEVYVNQEEG